MHVCCVVILRFIVRGNRISFDDKKSPSDCAFIGRFFSETHCLYYSCEFNILPNLFLNSFAEREAVKTRE